MSSVKTKWGKCVAVAMACALTLSSVPGTDAQAAKKATAKLAKTKLTVDVNGTATIKLKKTLKKAKYSYASNKKKIATVTKKGKVKGKSAGVAKITVTEKVGKKKYTVGKVTVTVKDKAKDAGTAPTVPAASVAPTTDTAASAAPTAPAAVVSAAPTTPATTIEPSAPATTIVPSAPVATSGTGGTKPTTSPNTPKTPTPTVRPNPTKDPYAKADGEGWQRLNLSTWSGGDKSKDYFKDGDQILLNDRLYATIPLPTAVESGSVEVIVRGTLPDGSDGIQLRLNNAEGTTAEDSYAGALSQSYQYKKGMEGFKTGEPVTIQTILEYDGTVDDKIDSMTGNDKKIAKQLLITSASGTAKMKGIWITSIFVRYGDKVGEEDPVIDSYSIDFENDRIKEEQFNAADKINDDKSVDITFKQGQGFNAYGGVNYLLPPSMEKSEFKYVTITYSGGCPGGMTRVYIFDEKTNITDPSKALAQATPTKHKHSGSFEAVTEEKSVTFSVTDKYTDKEKLDLKDEDQEPEYDFSQGYMRGIQFFSWGGGGDLHIKSIVFSRENPNAQE